MVEIKQNANSNPPVPSIVICLDKFTAQAIQSVQHIYLRSDQRRGIVTEFSCAMAGETSSLTQLCSLSENVITSNDSSEQTDPLELRRTAFQNFVRNTQMLKTELEQIIHSMRTHERLMVAGWGQVYDVPLHIFILADACDPGTAGAVIPWMVLLHQITQDHPLIFAHVLCNVASFPVDTEDPIGDQQLQVNTFLGEIDQFLHFDSETRQQLHNLMGLSDLSPWMPAIFLFDRHKEGTYMVKDKAEMQTLIGNSLLALLQNGVARHITRYHDENEIFESHSFYNSLGVSALMYDPQSLQAACAQKVVLANFKTKQLAFCKKQSTVCQCSLTFTPTVSKMPRRL